MDGRQFGRGKSGGQVRDEYRTDYDLGRGGLGKLVQAGLAQKTHGGGDGRPQEQPALQGGWPASGVKRGRPSEEITPRADSKRARDDRSNPRFRGEQDE